MERLEPALIGLFFAGWAGALLHQWGILSLAGTLSIGLYPFFSLAAALGWVSGNVYVLRRRGLPRPMRRKVLLVYLVGPPGILFLLRSFAPAADQQVAPLVPLLGFGVFAVFFCVPVALSTGPDQSHGTG